MLPRIGCGLVLGLALGCGIFPNAAVADPTEAELARALAEARGVEADVVQTLARVRRASVSILNKERLRARGSSALLLGGVGSGVLVRYRNEVWVLTNFHVVDDARHVEVVTSDGRSHRVRLRASDESIDLALLAFDRPPEDLYAITLAPDARPNLSEGTWVVATGNPFFLALDGLDVATLGVISGTRGEDANSYVEGDVLQHDAEINPGNSGGPLWNLRGELVGINGTIASRSRSQGSGPAYTGASFSVPLAEIQGFLRRVPDQRGSTVASAPSPGSRMQDPPPVVNPPGYLGIRYRTSRTPSGQPAGVVVTSVSERSPAAGNGGRGGLRPGDVITELVAAGRVSNIRTAGDLQSAIADSPPGTAVSIRFYRKGRPYAWNGVLTRR
ncbi:MAG: S1C family serine protease [Planctomycetota bacterium]